MLTFSVNNAFDDSPLRLLSPFQIYQVYEKLPMLTRLFLQVGNVRTLTIHAHMAVKDFLIVLNLSH
jgi:hypothetical protein